jgi:predicted ATP-dependent serine protease
MRRYMKAAKAGAPVGLLTGFAHLDHHWGGLLPGQFIELLGRTGEGKSLKAYAMALHCKLQGARVGIFTPELSRHEVKCRIHTMCSARPEVKAALGLKHSFRNRALMFRGGFNLKSYQAFCEYFADELPGRMYMLSGTGMSDQMSVGYIEDRIVEYELDIVFVDPIYLLKPVRYTSEGNTYQETAWTAESLHRIGEAYNIPIVFTNQAHLDGPAGDAPDKSKSFGAKALLHLTDYVLGIKHLSDENRMICKCSKSRFGQNHFRYEIMLHANTGAIKEMTPIQGNYMNGKDDDWEEEEVEEATKIAKGKGKHTAKGKVTT